VALNQPEDRVPIPRSAPDDDVEDLKPTWIDESTGMLAAATPGIELGEVADAAPAHRAVAMSGRSAASYLRNLLLESQAMADLSGRPLLETAADARLYVERGVDSDLERYALAGLNTMLVGDRGEGKTSALRQLVRRLRQDPKNVVVFVDGSLLGPQPADLVNAILNAVGHAPGLSDRLRQGVLTSMGPSTGRGANEFLLDGVRRLRRAKPEGAQRAIAVVDSLLSAEAPHTLFGRLRDELWQTPWRFVVSADSSISAQILRPPADAFFEEVLHLEPFSPEEQYEFARRRLGAGEARRVAEGIRRLDEGNARRLLRGLRHLAAEGEAVGFLTGQEERARRLRDLGSPAQMLVAELERLGPRSASDEELLRRLGWSRQRAAQVFEQLVKAGIVTGTRQAGPKGRPRRVFALVEPERLVAS
jgi:Cdc6-like AAA superfamily ATPase